MLSVVLIYFYLLGALFALGHPDVQLCHRGIVSSHFSSQHSKWGLFKWTVQLPQMQIFPVVCGADIASGCL